MVIVLTCTHCIIVVPLWCHRADHDHLQAQVSTSPHVTRQTAHRHSLSPPHSTLCLVVGIGHDLLISASSCRCVLIIFISTAVPFAVLLLARPPPVASLCELSASAAWELVSAYWVLCLLFGCGCWRRGPLVLVALCALLRCFCCAGGHLVQCCL
jgi:hypothetical protein